MRVCVCVRVCSCMYSAATCDYFSQDSMFYSAGTQESILDSVSMTTAAGSSEASGGRNLRGLAEGGLNTHTPQNLTR